MIITVNGEKVTVTRKGSITIIYSEKDGGWSYVASDNGFSRATNAFYRDEKENEQIVKAALKAVQ